MSKEPEIKFANGSKITLVGDDETRKFKGMKTNSEFISLCEEDVEIEREFGYYGVHPSYVEAIARLKQSEKENTELKVLLAWCIAFATGFYDENANAHSWDDLQCFEKSRIDEIILEEMKP